MPETFYLIDGHALAYRTYFALTGAGKNTDRWITSKGEQTAGVYGFASVLLRLIETEEPDYLAVAFDTGKTFRDEIFPDYKATREKMPDDLRTQIKRMRELVDIFNIPRYEIQGFEADDVLGSAAKKIAAMGYGVKIITGDKDLLQLVTDRIIVSLPGKSISDSTDYTPDKVFEKMKVRPDQIVDYKALVGDRSDNIPGVKGIGAKSAEKFLGAFDNLDGVYENIETYKPGQIDKLKRDKEQAYMSQKLAQIVTDIDILVDMEGARTSNFSPDKVEKLFREMEFRTLMPRLKRIINGYGLTTSAGSSGQMSMFSAGFESDTTGDAAEIVKTIIVDTEKKLTEMVKVLNAAKMIAFDTETTGTDKMAVDLVGISLAVDGETGYYIPVGHRKGDQLELDLVIESIRKPMTDPKIGKAGHNLKFDYVMLKRYGLDVQPLSFDSMIAEWLNDPGSRNLGLKNLAWVRQGIKMTNIEELIGKGKSQITMAEVSIEIAAPYAAADAAVVMMLIPELEKSLKEKEILPIFEKYEMPFISTLADMEIAGIGLDTEFLSNMAEELKTKMNELVDNVYKRVGAPFNLNSTQQLSDALFKTLGLTAPEGTKKTASGHFSTAASVLEQLRDQDEIIVWILEYRELAKLQSTYVEALPRQVNQQTKRVHTSYSQTGSVTGRLASNNPNLQNIPIKTEVGRRVREAFIAKPGHLLLAVDYSQIELRIVAHMSGDEMMISAFNEDQDIHSITAAEVMGLEMGNITKYQRNHAKAINFGLIYGMSPFGLTQATDLTLAEAENFVKEYFSRFSGVKKFLDDLREQVLEDEYVETLLGRRRYFYGIKNQQNQMIRSRLLREAINAPIQGTAADLMKIAMLEIEIALKESGLRSRMLLQVHDEVILECPEAELQETAQLVMDKMSGVMKFSVPLKTDARAGINWGKMKEIDF
jgi:DNA polymerase-1